LSSRDIAILHPGEMGVTVAAALSRGGARVHWLSSGRSAETRRRAEQAGLVEVESLQRLCELCEFIVSVCPPQFARPMADSVAACGFGGTYVDANAVSPRHAVQIRESVEGSGASFVDGGIVGPPAWEPGTTVLFLSGKRAAEMAACFSAGPVEAQVLDGDPGMASALKMCDSVFQKGVLALLYDTLATAERLGVRRALGAHWQRDPGGVPAVSMECNRVGRSARKGWRFLYEIDEVIDTLESVGVPPGSFLRARAVFKRLSGFRSSTSVPPEDAVVDALLAPDSD
jgi:3-hydroxyisobutyrate dehydrogenase-like beta-hydroxyacid dehydrogenase